MQIEQHRLTDTWAVRDRWVLVQSRSALAPSSRVLLDELIHSGVGGSDHASATPVSLKQKHLDTANQDE